MFIEELSRHPSFFWGMVLTIVFRQVSLVAFIAAGWMIAPAAGKLALRILHAFAGPHVHLVNLAS